MEDATKSCIGLSKEQAKAVLENIKLFDFQVERINKVVQKFEKKGYTTGQTVKSTSSFH